MICLGYSFVSRQAHKCRPAHSETGNKNLMVATNREESRKAMSERDFIKSIERGFMVLNAFDAEMPHPTLAALASRTNLSRPAIRRILLTLQQLGYVDTVRGRWSLTPRVLSIGQHYTVTHALTEIAQPHMLALGLELSEPVSLAVLDGMEAVHVADVPVQRIMRINVSVGMRVPAYATSLGRVLLAWRGQEFIDNYLEDVRMEAFTPHTRATAREFRLALEHVRADGYALVEEELEEGLLSAAVPIRNSDGDVVAALASWTSTGRMSGAEMRQQIVPRLIRTGEKISCDFGRSQSEKMGK